MEPLVKLVATLLFLFSAISFVYAWSCYERYRSFWRQNEAVGMISRIRASIQLTHDPSNSSDDCKLALVRLKSAILISVMMVLSIAAFVLIVRFFGYGASD